MLASTLLVASLVGLQGKPLEGFAFTTELKTLVVFREGFGFYQREGKARLQNGWATTSLIPRAMGGTFWVRPMNPADRVDVLVTTPDNRLAFDGAVQLRAVLLDKIGLRLNVAAGGRVAKGQLAAVLGDMLLIKEPSGAFTAIEYAKVDSVSLADFPLRVKLRTQAPNAEAGIGIAYVQEGVTWEPSYVLDVVPGDKGRLTLRGTLLNLDEPLRDARLVFVIGSPAMGARGTIDSLLQGFRFGDLDVLGKSIDFISFDPSDNSLALEGATARAEEAKRRIDARKPGAIAPQDSGELRYYTLPNFSLRPGERAMSSIYETEIPVRRFVEWDADSGDLTALLTLENRSAEPFTPAPVFVVEGGRPLGQAPVEYTAAGGSAEIRIATATTLKVERSEVETGRRPTLAVGKAVYLPIVLQGSLTLENLGHRPADVRVKRSVLGKVQEVEGGVVKDVRPGNGPNAQNALEWRVTIPPGGRMVLRYTYETYALLGG